MPTLGVAMVGLPSANTNGVSMVGLLSANTNGVAMAGLPGANTNVQRVVVIFLLRHKVVRTASWLNAVIARKSVNWLSRY